MPLTIKSEIFTRAVDKIIKPEELEKKLASGRPLRIKHGIDATGSNLHLGHAASLWKIRALQEAGHKAVILLGDFTTQIGDPTGKSKTRPVLPANTIRKNIKSIEGQVKKILLTNPKVFELRRNSEWYSRTKLTDFLRITSLITHARLIERDMFRERIKKGNEIFMPEFVYPILQGYDSVILKSDLTIIGSDQLFNEHLGRFFQEKFGQAPQVIVALKMLPGLGGEEKMSKSLGNYIGVNDAPQDKFGKAMRTADSLIVPYLESYTDVSMKEIKKAEQELKSGKNPMEVKLFFAEALVKRYHGVKIAAQEREKFLRIFSQRQIPESLPALKIRHGQWSVLEFLLAANLAPSKSEARRLLKQRAVEIDGKLITSPTAEIEIKKSTLVRVGKRKLSRVS